MTVAPPDYDFKLARIQLAQQKKLIRHMDAGYPSFQAELAKLFELILLVRCKKIDVRLPEGRFVVSERIAAEIEPIFVSEY